MTTFQKVIKYAATALAIILSVSIISSITGIIALFSGLTAGKAVNDEVKSYNVSSGITDLCINIKAADLCIKQGDSFRVESNLKNLTVTEKNGTLTLKEKKKLGFLYHGAVLTVYLPQKKVIKNAEISTGAGLFTLENFSAESLTLKLGAGDVNINALTVTAKADIDGGAGRINFENSSLTNLDLDMGVGQLNLSSIIRGNSEMNLGVGESNIMLIGSKEDYSIDIDKGIGKITVDGKSATDFEFQGGKLGRIEIDGGIGAVNLGFSKTK